MRAAVLLSTFVFSVLLLAAPTVAQTPVWTSIGSATVDGGGSWRFVVNAGQDLIGTQMTLIRVTSGDCASAPSQAIVMEARLQATQAGNGSWEGKLAPAGGLASSLATLDPNSGDVQLVPSPPGTRIDTGLDGITPGLTLSVCAGQS